MNQFEFRLFGEGDIDGAACWRIESKPKESKASQYTSSRVWIRKDNYLPAQYENYAKDTLVRRMHEKDMESIQGVWTARTLEMNDVRRKSRTILKLENVRYNVPLQADEFYRAGAAKAAVKSLFPAPRSFCWLTPLC